MRRWAARPGSVAVSDSASEKVPTPTPFTWTKNRVEAAVLVADDDLSNDEIARACGISAKTLTMWKRHPEFAARVGQIVTDLQEHARKRGLARLDKRQTTAFDRHRRMVDLILARAGDIGNEAAGGETGLVVRQYRSIGTGPNARQVTEYVFDAALMRELRELEKQIAQDAGQWSEKRQVEHSGGLTFADLIGLAADGDADEGGGG